MLELLLVGTGGFIGSIARYLVSKATEVLPLNFPLATLCVNSLASLLVGMMLALTTAHFLLVPERVRLFIVVGVLGGFSTFSAFSSETLELVQNQEYLMAGLNIVLNVAVSLGMAALGFWLAHLALGTTGAE